MQGNRKSFFVCGPRCDGTRRKVYNLYKDKRVVPKGIPLSNHEILNRGGVTPPQGNLIS